MLSILSSIFGGLFSLISNWFGYKTSEVQAQAQVETASIQGMAAVEERWWFVAAMIPIISIPYAIYIWKAVAWDKIIAPHYHIHASTDPITGTLGYIFMIVIGGIFLQALPKK